MDEFYLEINSIFYLKWIVNQGKKYNLKIKFENDNEDTIIIKYNDIEAMIKYYGDGIFEQKIINCLNNDVVFYQKNFEETIKKIYAQSQFYVLGPDVYFKLKYLNHAIKLFEDMIDCIFEVANRPFVSILLCCSGGLTTTLFASKMMELAKLNKLSYQITATGYSRLPDIAKDYDIIMLAPQISYLLPQVEVLLPGKDVVVIPTKIFAMNDFSGALMIINELLENKEKN